MIRDAATPIEDHVSLFESSNPVPFKPWNCSFFGLDLPHSWRKNKLMLASKPRIGKKTMALRTRPMTCWQASKIKLEQQLLSARHKIGRAFLSMNEGEVTQTHCMNPARFPSNPPTASTRRRARSASRLKLRLSVGGCSVSSMMHH